MMSTGDPIQDHPHNYYNNPPSNYWKVNVADSVGLVFAVIFVFARCYTKFFVSKVAGWEDYTSVMSLMTFIPFTALNFVLELKFGAGRHSWDLPPEFYNGYLTVGPSPTKIIKLC